jgi:hypothetical protein
VEVSWTPALGISVDVFVIQNGISVQVGRDIISGQLSFDSTVFNNGEALILVEASNGVYSSSTEVSVQFNNNNPSSLPDITSSTNQNLPVLLFVEITIFWAFIVLLRRKS